ncbi:MAG: hypothetical protein HY466_02750 [Deltaproteobacteria bacterium]|nr:hypothetical protein [Deltaproteobacteria bacterium]
MSARYESPASLSPYREGESQGTADEMEGPRRYVAEAIQSSEANQTANAQDIYRRAVTLAQGILEMAKTGEEIKGQEMHGVIQDIIRGLTFGNKELLNLACSETVEASTGFLAAKMANKTILAVEIGIGKKINKSQLFQLGMAAFLSDLGVTQVLDVVTKKDVLTPEDWEKIREIPAKTVEILQKIPDLHQVVLTVAEEFRERSEDTAVQVQALQKMDPFSRIVALIDVFEALTHDRPYRARMMPHEAMRLILHGGGKKFEQETLRLLIDRIGLYPIGSWVKLSSKEFAKVVETNPGQPMRPGVKVLYDEKGRPLEEPVRLDLSKNLSIQILQPVAEKEIQKLTQKNA